MFWKIFGAIGFLMGKLNEIVEPKFDDQGNCVEQAGEVTEQEAIEVMGGLLQRLGIKFSFTIPTPEPMDEGEADMPEGSNP